VLAVAQAREVPIGPARHPRTGEALSDVSAAASGDEDPLAVRGVGRRLAAPAFGESGDKDCDAPNHEVHDYAHAQERKPRGLR
jgi:hypothetical protein